MNVRACWLNTFYMHLTQNLHHSLAENAAVAGHSSIAMQYSNALIQSQVRSSLTETTKPFEQWSKGSRRTESVERLLVMHPKHKFPWSRIWASCNTSFSFWWCHASTLMCNLWQWFIKTILRRLPQWVKQFELEYLIRVMGARLEIRFCFIEFIYIAKQWHA